MTHAKRGQSKKCSAQAAKDTLRRHGASRVSMHLGALGARTEKLETCPDIKGNQRKMQSAFYSLPY